MQFLSRRLQSAEHDMTILSVLPSVHYIHCLCQNVYAVKHFSPPRIAPSF